MSFEQIIVHIFVGGEEIASNGTLPFFKENEKEEDEEEFLGHELKRLAEGSGFSPLLLLFSHRFSITKVRDVRVAAHGSDGTHENVHAEKSRVGARQ